ncbi:hypothetical protein KI387_020268 [Taxus chinensis]|uniref:Uncharacterized protein n=1 Tax=Taxus chinensis TaxID=29808 RepID=A0AA38LAW4_TAXCH|nr:hypothetical protein KI387_020268 [Taxus chinensis]
MLSENKMDDLSSINSEDLEQCFDTLNESTSYDYWDSESAETTNDEVNLCLIELIGEVDKTSEVILACDADEEHVHEFCSDVLSDSLVNLDCLSHVPIDLGLNCNDLVTGLVTVQKTRMLD